MTSDPAGDLRASTLICDDIRLEVGNRFSLMGVMHTIAVEQLPVSLLKLAVLNHLEGRGAGNVQTQIITPDRSAAVVSSNPSPIDLSGGGYMFNMVFFGNVVFPEAGTYWVQTFLDSELVSEVPFVVQIRPA